MTHERKDTMKSVTGRITAAFLCAGIAVSSAWADRFVSPAGGNQPPYDSWANAATTIQTAINAASAGETVWVTNGATFVLSAEIALNKAVTVRGYGEPKPVVNGNGAVRGFNISSSGATLDGLVVSNGFTTGSGGGITMTGGTVQNCSVVTNRANANGGGIYMTGGTVRDSDIAFNQVPTTSGDVYGGGIRMTAGTVTNCTIRFNYCDRRYGGVGLTGADAKLLGSVLEGNRSRTFPGAGAGLEAAALIDGCTFTNNVCSGNGGGGVSLNTTDGAVLRNSRFYNNQGSAGGGVHMTSASLVSNCVFVGNSGTIEGGALYIDKGLAVNCVIRANSAPGGSGGGGVMSRGTNRAILRNCLIVGNMAANFAGGVISIGANGLILENCTIADNNQYGVLLWQAGAIYTTNSIVYYNTNSFNRTAEIGYTCGPGLSGGGNITADPQFANRAGGDYTLLKTSPCLDAGLGRTWMTDAIDLAGNPRLAYKVRGGASPFH